MQKKDKNPKRCWLITGIILSALLCIVNIVLSCVYHDVGTNIFSAISGWIGGISTIILGIIAFKQSQHYTIISFKKDLKQEIHDEEKELLNLFDIICQHSKLTQVLKIAVLPMGPNDINGLEYKIQVDSLRETLTSAALKIQMIKIASVNMSNVVTKINEMVLHTQHEYKVVMDHFNNDALLSEDIKKINSIAIVWIMEMVKMRNEAIDHCRTLKKDMENCTSIDELNTLRKTIDNDFENAQKECKESIDQMIKNCEENEENDHGKNEDAK